MWRQGSTALHCISQWNHNDTVYASHIRDRLRPAWAMLNMEEPIRSELHRNSFFESLPPTARPRKREASFFSPLLYNAASWLGGDLTTSIFGLVSLAYALVTTGPRQRHINRSGLGGRVIQKAPTAAATTTASLPIQWRWGSTSTRAATTACSRRRIHFFVILCSPGWPGALVYQGTRSWRELEKDTEAQEWRHGLHAAATKAAKHQSGFQSTHFQRRSRYSRILSSICILCHWYEKIMGCQVSKTSSLFYTHEYIQV